MNQPDPNYWLTLAAQWIQSKSQTQLNFPNYPFSQQIPQQIPQAPAPPRISMNDATVNDNLVEADMEIEDEKEEIDRDWHSEQNHPVAPRFPAAKIQKFESRFTTVQIPSAPIISGQMSESSRSSPRGGDSNHVDMVLDSDHEEQDDFDDETNSAIIEAQRRKKLPLWIREGLEKREREKKQEQERIEREHEMAKDEENRKKIMEEALKELEQEKKNSKSKYDSESDDDRGETPETETKPVAAESEDEEEQYEKMMLLVRKTLTEILKETTDEKIQEISKETLSRYKKKASSVKVTPLKVSLGLGVYSSSSDEDSDGEKSEAGKSDGSEWERDSIIKERIRVKTIAFEQRSKEVKERLAKLEEAEQEHFNKKQEEAREHSKRRDSDSEKCRKNDGEEKYEQNYSFSGSFARQREKKKTRFNDPKERSSSILVTHVGMMEKQSRSDNGSTSFGPVPPPPSISFSPKKEKSRKRSSSSSSSSNSSRHKKHKKKHKKSGKSKKSSKKRDRSKNRHSIESRSSVRSSDSRRHRSRSRQRSRSRSRSNDRRSRRY